MKITTIGLDLAKNVFHIIGLDDHGKVVKKKKLRRSQVLSFFVQLPPCLIGMEACGGAHYWGRELEKQGHTVKLLPPQHVKAYVRGNKTDYNDALGIAEAVTRPQMRAVSIKTPAQQDMQALHRMRIGVSKERKSVGNRLRGLLAEYGIVLAKELNTLRRCLPEILEDAENGLSDGFRALLNRGYQHLCWLDEQFAWYDHLLKQQVKESEVCQRLQSTPGYGPILASAFASHVGDGSAYGKGRHVAAAVGLVPRQHSSGDKPVLLGISKRGDTYLRSLLVQGARAVVSRAQAKDDPLSRWINRIVARRGFNKAVVAYANKMARIGWVIVSHEEMLYQPQQAAA
jgi:transposase